MLASPVAVLYIINSRLILPSGCTHLMELSVQIPQAKCCIYSTSQAHLSKLTKKKSKNAIEIYAFISEKLKHL